MKRLPFSDKFSPRAGLAGASRAILNRRSAKIAEVLELNPEISSIAKWRA
jgi:hypothetical protein